MLPAPLQHAAEPPSPGVSTAPYAYGTLLMACVNGSWLAIQLNVREICNDRSARPF
ncbi:hypothetical protein IEO21_02648 [Rhodonia placenta]|uniref:Uncharacterized protein n=1 Tax=Rhodonia placenta TaxID=104341 RepID=A0A8H7P7V2_9APHY|nr:hypothetical protein IEO21_02648 [Postia placenta]